MAKAPEKITVVAECSVKSPDGEEIIRSFDKAWHRALVLPKPVTISFIRFARIEEKGKK